MDGALLIDKPEGISSFGIIEELKRLAMRRLGVKHRDLPGFLQKMGHGGTLDPFATGLLIVFMGRGAKLSRYFLGSEKTYEATLRFGQTTVPGDPTSELSERSEHLPASLQELREMAGKFSAQPYLQTPPMHSAKKKDGKTLYELARQGIEIERDPKLCHLYALEFSTYENDEARFRVCCSSGTYIRTLAQDFARLLGSVGMLSSLRRTGSGSFHLSEAMNLAQITDQVESGTEWSALPCFVPFDELLRGYPRALATDEEALSLQQGRQSALLSILKRATAPESAAKYAHSSDTLAIYWNDRLFAIAGRGGGSWELERVFPHTPD